MTMNDKELIGYCDMHCETPRALFSREHVNRMLALAGHPKGWAHEVPKYKQFVAVHEEMKELCELARKRMHVVANTPIPNNVILFKKDNHAQL